jgi:hypothetical protein
MMRLQGSKDCPKANIYLVQGVNNNLDFNPELMVYDKHYQNEQAISLSFRKHLLFVKKSWRLTNDHLS